MNKHDYSIYSDKIKSSVSCRQFLEANGVKVGRHGFAVCPLHGDSDASLKVYDNGRGWCCYGCHKGGDVINLAREMYGVGFNDAIRRLNEDFNLGFDLGSKPSQKELFLWKVKQNKEKYEAAAKQKKRENAEKAFLDALTMWRLSEQMLELTEPKPGEEWSSEFILWINIRNTMKELSKLTCMEWVAYG